jgi:hypothetical protein
MERNGFWRKRVTDHNDNSGGLRGLRTALIGAGGTGEVYRAADTSKRRPAIRSWCSSWRKDEEAFEIALQGAETFEEAHDKGIPAAISSPRR